MKNAATTVLELAGAALIVAGTAMVSVPVALVLAGAFLIGISLLVVRR